MGTSFKMESGTSLAVPWLRLHFFAAEGMGSISGGGTKIPCAAKRHSQSFTMESGGQRGCSHALLLTVNCMTHRKKHKLALPTGSATTGLSPGKTFFLLSQQPSQ